jgi:hypothetical protein
MHFHKPRASLPKLLITPYFTLHLNKKSARDDAQSRLAFLAGTYNHAAVELALSAFTSHFSTFSLQFIDRTFDHRQIGKKGFGKFPYLIAELNKALPKPAEFLSIYVLYAH